MLPLVGLGQRLGGAGAQEGLVGGTQRTRWGRAGQEPGRRSSPPDAKNTNVTVTLLVYSRGDDILDRYFNHFSTLSSLICPVTSSSTPIFIVFQDLSV